MTIGAQHLRIRTLHIYRVRKMIKSIALKKAFNIMKKMIQIMIVQFLELNIPIFK
jgi:hypothetical protein